MIINICDWHMGSCLEGTKYTHGQVIEGDIDRVFEISNELFIHGLNTMLLHINDGVRIWVDDRNFRQR